MKPVFVCGRPSLFLTPRERAWREVVRASGVTGLVNPRLAFTVASNRRGGQNFDIDNLAKPVLEIVATDPASIWVTVSVGTAEGVLIDDAGPPIASSVEFEVDVPSPRRRSVRPLIPLVETHGMPVIEPIDATVGLELSFDAASEPIGDFGFEGPIKPLIDALGDVLGTYSAGPRDYRVRELRVRKGQRPGGSCVRLSIWRL